MDQNYLKKVLSYCPASGVFTWRESRGPVKAGSEAGCANPHGYIFIRIDTILHRAHRLAWLYMTGDFPEDEIDHINGDKGDNRFANLREASHSQNMQNRKLNKNNKTGTNGVYLHEQSGKWLAFINFEGKKKYLGLFITKERAVEAREQAEKQYGFHENHGR